MERRSFLKFFGVAPVVPVIAKASTKEPKEVKKVEPEPPKAGPARTAWPVFSSGSTSIHW